MFKIVSIIIVLIVAVELLTGCIEHRPPQESRRDRPVSAQLMSLREQVQWIVADTARTAYERRSGLSNNRQVVYSLMSRALIQDANDLQLAASIIFQASDGSTPEAHSIAVILANQALSEANPDAKPAIQALLDSLARFPK